METEFVFWGHETSVGVNVEEICGGEDKSARLWKTMALQVFGENGKDRFRTISHTETGAPLLTDSEQRISISHTPHFMVIAMLPRTPEADLEKFSFRTAMGIDCERKDREQVLKVADRVLSSAESVLVGEYASTLEAGDTHHPPMATEEAKIRAHVLSWTIKEALYKAALTPGLDFREQLTILSMPEICGHPTIRNPKLGKGIIKIDENREVEMNLFSYMSEEHVVTIALSPKCATYHKN